MHVAQLGAVCKHPQIMLQTAVNWPALAGFASKQAAAVGIRGCSSGVGDSLVEFARAKGVDMVAVGSRGMGSMKRSLMSLVGLGSVSDYVLHQLHVPVLVVHTGQAPTAAAAAGSDQVSAHTWRHGSQSWCSRGSS